MTDNKTVSIIIPVFNVEPYLERCVNSVLQQSYENLEIILVDDCSTDNSPSICDSFALKDSRIKVIHKEKNEGLGFARNTGIENSDGGYIMFLDSDDYLDKDACLIAKNNLEENGCDICCFLCAEVYSNRIIYDNSLSAPLLFEGEKITTEFLPQTIAPKETALKNELALDVSACKVMYCASLIKENSLRFVSEREFLNEDLVFRMELCKYVNKAIILPDNLYFYFHNSGTLTTRYNENRFEASVKMFHKTKELSSDFSCKELERRVERYFMSNVLVCIKQSVAVKKKESIKIIKKMCENATLQKVLEQYPVEAMPTSQKLLFEFIKAKRSRAVYVLTLIKLRTENKSLS